MYYVLHINVKLAWNHIEIYSGHVGVHVEVYFSHKNKDYSDTRL